MNLLFFPLIFKDVQHFLEGMGLERTDDKEIKDYTVNLCIVTSSHVLDFSPVLAEVTIQWTNRLLERIILKKRYQQLLKKVLHGTIYHSEQYDFASRNNSY